MWLASESLAGRKNGGFFGPRASVGHPPQFLQGIQDMNTQLLAHLHSADIDVEDGDDGNLLEVCRGNAVDDAPEPPDVVAQRLPGFLLQVIEIKGGCRVQRATGLEVLARLTLHFLPGAAPGVGVLADTTSRKMLIG